jgi:hypothetical protein
MLIGFVPVERFAFATFSQQAFAFDDMSISGEDRRWKPSVFLAGR